MSAISGAFMNELLFKAAEAGDLEQVKALIAGGADVKIKDDGEYGSGETLLHQAAKSGNIELVQWLMA